MVMEMNHGSDRGSLLNQVHRYGGGGGGGGHRSQLVLVLGSLILLAVTVNFWATRSMILSGSDHNNKNNNADVATGKKIYYSVARTDRAGATIHDMLLAHAYSFHQGAVYGGACCSRGWPFVPRRASVQLLRTMELYSVLPFACPPIGFTRSKQDHVETIPAKVYRTMDATLFTSEWRETLRKQQQQYVHAEKSLEPSSSSAPRKTYQIAVHVRRGDINPCRHPKRYLPNKHYLTLLDEYKPENITDYVITIYSEHPSYEGFDDFLDYDRSHVRLRLDTSLDEVWLGLMTADVAILSQSSFSYVPAVLNPNHTVVYTPFPHRPVLGWQVVSESLYQAARHASLGMQEQACRQNPHWQAGWWRRTALPRWRQLWHSLVD